LKEIKDAKGKRVAIAQIMRLADVPELNFWPAPPLETLANAKRVDGPIGKSLSFRSTF
jgi:hypothetical protein